MNIIEIKNLTKKFEGKTIIDHLSLNFEVGKIYSIVAPSGAGKTTLLRIIAGLEDYDSGVIRYETTPRIGFIFQESSIFPWLKVRDNLMFSIENGTSIEHILPDEDASGLFNELGLINLLDRYPKQLSGGQKQRVVFGRSLILHPNILLCDEPFSALDDEARKEMRDLLLIVHRRYKPTIIFVTHSLEEAEVISDSVIRFSRAPLENKNIFK